MARRVLIAGCGYVGSALARELIARGDRVTCLRRSDAPVPSGTEFLQADLRDPGTLSGRLSGPWDAVVYSAAAGGSTDPEYEAAYVRGIRNLLGEFESASVSVGRLLFTSSTGVYAQDDGSWVDEDSPTLPRSFTGIRLLEGESVVRQAPVPAVILRLGGIYGPGRDRLIRLARSGVPTPPADGGGWTNRIHRDDCAGALLHLIDLPEPESLYVGVDEEPARLGTILAWIREREGIPQPSPARLADPAPGPAPTGLRGANRRVSSARLRKSGYTFRFPTFREGFGAILSGED